jgi:hypothetical protein
MNKKFLALGIVLLFVASIFVGCDKQHVKFGEKRIVGTWILTMSSSSTSSTDITIRTYEANECDYESYQNTDTEEYTSNYDGTTLTNYSKSKSVYISGTETETVESDTTINYTYSLELTFNEDGTCYVKTNRTDNGDGEVFNLEETGRWNWIDANEEKVGIYLYGDYMNSYEELYIETLSTKELVISYNKSGDVEDEYTTTYDDYCYNYETNEYSDLTFTSEGTGTEVETGSQTFTKSDEKDDE